MSDGDVSSQTEEVVLLLRGGGLTLHLGVECLNNISSFIKTEFGVEGAELGFELFYVDLINGTVPEVPHSDIITVGSTISKHFAAESRIILSSSELLEILGLIFGASIIDEFITGLNTLSA